MPLTYSCPPSVGQLSVQNWILGLYQKRIRSSFAILRDIRFIVGSLVLHNAFELFIESFRALVSAGYCELRAADFHLRKRRLLSWETKHSKHSRCPYTSTWQAGHSGTHSCVLQNFSDADFCKTLLGNIPNPLIISKKLATHRWCLFFN